MLCTCRSILRHKLRAKRVVDVQRDARVRTQAPTHQEDVRAGEVFKTPQAIRSILHHCVYFIIRRPHLISKPVTYSLRKYQDHSEITPEKYTAGNNEFPKFPPVLDFSTKQVLNFF